MGVIVCCKSLAFVTLIFLCREFCTVAQPGFVSIDCGGKMNRTDPETNISWVTDDQFINSGQSADINDANLSFYLRTRRVFTKPVNKSCYKLNLTPNVTHYLRIWFVGSNYSPTPPQFYYSIQTREMLSMRKPTIQSNPPQPSEKILVSSGNELYICLFRTADSVDPFISAIELRKLEKGMYNSFSPNQMLHSILRYDIGGKSKIRYPQDRFDRLWWPMSVEGAKTVSLPGPVSVNDTKDFPPSIVMETAVTHNQGITMNFGPPINPGIFLLLYFADIQLSHASQSRIFNISINGAPPSESVRRLGNLSATEITLPYDQPLSSFGILKASTRSPIINAVEIYQIFTTEPLTYSKDAEALTDLKQLFNPSNWVSDPCFGLPWEGIQCNSSTDVRVSEIELSRRNLRGSIPSSLAQLSAVVNMSLDNNNLTGLLPNMSSLTKLERLHLQNNNLGGPVPDWLTQLPNLKELFIQNNNFSGPIPAQLLNSSVRLSYSGNRFLYVTPSPSHSNRRKVGIIVGVTVGGVVAIALAFLAAILAYRRKFREKEIVKTNTKGWGTSTSYTSAHGEDYSMVLVPNPTRSRAFTLEELLMATENFTNRIGQGGFGSVYLGKLQEGKQIAVKVLSACSKQGVVEFLNEIDLLSKINHKNLVSLLGYCNESRELMLVYDYMPGGSLMDHLYGPNAGKYPKLDWKKRLQIGLDAAQGLEYLHVSCTPKIIHRDVKTANILLDANLNGKLADFGLSRVTMDEDESYIATTVKGTPGYLDPQYFSTQMLTEKSDVYSFGVVLLEIICGRRPIDSKLTQEEVNLIRWVTPYVKGDEELSKISEIVDKRLGDGYDTKSIVHVARMALRCVEFDPSIRPSVSDVVVEIKEAIKYQKEAAKLNEHSEDTYVEYGESQNSQISITDLSGPKEIGWSEISANFTQEGR